MRARGDARTLCRMSRAALGTALVLVSLVACSGDDPQAPPSPGDARDAGAVEPRDAATTAAPDAAAEGADAGSIDAGPEYSGEATYYDADGTGACGFPASTDFFVAAMNGAQYAKADCGRCVSVTGPKGTVTVRIVDKCPGCDEGDLDLSMTAFGKIAKLSDGRVPITWRFVTCP